MDIKKCSQKLSIRNSDMVEFHKAQTILRQIGGSQWNLCSSCLHQCLDHRFRKASWEPVFHGEKMMNGKLCVQLFQEHFSSNSSRVQIYVARVSTMNSSRGTIGRYAHGANHTGGLHLLYQCHQILQNQGPHGLGI